MKLIKCIYGSQVDPLSTISAIRPKVTHGQQHVKQPANRIYIFFNFTANDFFYITNEISDNLIYIETYKC